VYELGHVFKDLSNIYSFQNNNVGSIIPEDLMMRFAEKLDFGDFTNKIAADATRLCQRMGRDWMVMGRRPSGICGACLLMAARMWNFRRTVREIVYVVKVTTHTIEQRLDEFTVTESSNLSIEHFLNHEFLESRHDPPSFYKQTDAWKDKIEAEREASGKKRKRAVEDVDDNELDEADGDSDPSTRVSSISTSMPPPPRPVPPPDLSKVRQVTEFLPKSFDRTESREMVEPFDPSQIPRPAPKRPKDVAEGLSADDPTSNEAIDQLVEIYGSAEASNGNETNEAAEEEGEEEETESQPKKGRRRNKHESEEERLKFDEEWERDEAELENQINEVINDPHSSQHSKALATAAHLAHIKAEWARSLLPQRELKMDEIIGEDEFADDPEVQFCELDPEEVLIKEEIWLNANKDWVRKQQEKTYRQQMEDLGPPKRKRNRVKRPRIGEGQLTPASTPGEAAIDVMKKRNTVSKRINYDAIANLFGSSKKNGPGSVASRMESEAASHTTSRAASVSDTGSSSRHRDSPEASSGGNNIPKAAGGQQNEDVEEEEEEEEEEPAPIVYDYEEDYEDDDYGDGDGDGGYDDGEGEVY
jgi:transcription factor IIIB 90 kDa subunit